MSQLLLAFRLCLVLVLLAAAVAKSREFSAFTDSVTSLDVVPAWFVRPGAALVVALEYTAAALLAYPWSTWLGFAVATGLCVVFSAMPAIALARRKAVTCACFGAAESPLGWWQLGRNLVLLAMAALGFAGPVLAGPATGIGLPDVVLTAVAAAFAAALIVFSDRIAFLFQTPQPQRGSHR